MAYEPHCPLSHGESLKHQLIAKVVTEEEHKPAFSDGFFLEAPRLNHPEPPAHHKQVELSKEDASAEMIKPCLLLLANTLRKVLTIRT